MEAREDRSWAVGMEQHVFEREYFRHYPGRDPNVIPDVKIWTEGVVDMPSRGIDPFVPEALEPEPKAPSKPTFEKEVDDGKKVYFCPGCNREFNHHLGHRAHMKHCKALLNTKLAPTPEGVTKE